VSWKLALVISRIFIFFVFAARNEGPWAKVKRRKTENKKNQQPPSYDSNMANAKMPTICVHTHLDAKTMMMVVYCFQWCGGAAVLWRCGAADNDDSQSGKTCETWANNYTWIPDQLDVVSALFPPFQYPRSGCHCNCCLFGVGF